MYHSHLLINVGDNPDRPDWNACRKWLRNLYRVHQRLCMAFPSAVLEETERAAAYCRPFDPSEYPLLRHLPDDSGGCDVHHARSGQNGFLFRIDYPVDTNLRVRMPVIIVQSASSEEPDWRGAFGVTRFPVCQREPPIGNAGLFLAGPPQVKPISFRLDGQTLNMESPKQKYEIHSGDPLRFRLRANPTRKENGKRKRIRPTLKAHVDWLAGKLGEAGEFPGRFSSDEMHHENIHAFVPGWAYGWRTKYEPQPEHHAQEKEPEEVEKKAMQWWSVLFEGTFRVKDPAALKVLLECGIGPGKAFGFGLLSIAPA